MHDDDLTPRRSKDDGVSMTVWPVLAIFSSTIVWPWASVVTFWIVPATGPPWRWTTRLPIMSRLAWTSRAPVSIVPLQRVGPGRAAGLRVGRSGNGHQHDGRNGGGEKLAHVILPELNRIQRGRCKRYPLRRR
ncbi:hypothetical protein F1643_04945 [Azospirillum sp. INR13]|uniref:hypothetical protein n=1 Tax=Azospirillum sp. INR13 TaxID=2596919 RepID=UPI0018923BA9|nr:hypothetical protein [Azospirillum sp. INR13]MBF5093926.1 hypothetical protein [Azospirillum sp. INR13]